jgi:ribosomal protein S18 acetylase RimI-like enzyme
MSTIPDLVPVELRDRDTFVAMAQQYFQELNPEFVPARDWNASYFENIHGNLNYSLRWIVIGGQRVGFVLYGFEEHRFLPRKTGAIYELYVSPQQRGRGIARACAESVIEEMQKSSPSKIQLEVGDGNAVAAAFWKSLGFQKASERLVLTANQRATPHQRATK